MRSPRAAWLLVVLTAVPAGAAVILPLAECKDAPAGASRKVDLAAGLAGHWPLAGDTRDRSGNDHHATNHGVDLKTDKTAATLDGLGAHLEVPVGPSLKLGTGEFTVAVWLHSERQPEGPGCLLSQRDPRRRRGFHLTLKTSTGVTLSQPNARHLQFGIDNDRATPWKDCGRPGRAVLVFALATHAGHLYAGTCEPGKGESGRVYRYAGDRKWIDCGAPAPCNAVTALAVFDGKLYAGVGKYRLAGSALPESENPHAGGRVFRYEGGTRWTDCGQLPGVESVGGMVVWRGRLYASSLYRPAGFFRYEGGSKWTDAGTPGGKRAVTLGVHRGLLHATSYDEGHVYRHDGKAWTDLGRLGASTQTYSFAEYEGRLHVGTWPQGRVYRLDGSRWTDLGQLGEELEVMGMLEHNGRLLAGTLPRAEVYALEGDRWQRLAQLDATEGVRYRRAWTMAEHDGQLFCGTLPSGRVFAFAAGRTAAWDHELPPGWRHVVAVRRAGVCELYVDGERVARSTSFTPAEYDLTSDRPLRIGTGPAGPFRGRLRDVRLYRRALDTGEIRELARREGR